jgi:hypothetical protein
VHFGLDLSIVHANKFLMDKINQKL